MPVSEESSLQPSGEGWRWEEEEGPLRRERVRREVLVVEDDPTHREVLAELLEEWGYAPVLTGSAEEAEQVVGRHPVEAAVVDVYLPGRSGAQLLARLRERFPQAVLIGVSALGDAALSRTCKGLGADRFLDKPVAPEALAAALQGPHVHWH